MPIDNENTEDTGWTQLPLTSQKQQDEEPAEPEDTNIDTDDEGVEDITLEEMTEEPIKEPTASKENPKADKEPAAAKKEPRAQARIRQLANERREVEETLAKERKERQELEKRLKQIEMSTTTSSKTQIESRIELLNKQLRAALEEGDNESVVSLQNDLLEGKMELATVSARHQAMEVQSKEDETKEAQPPQRKQAEIPEQAREWIERNPSFLKDRTFNTMALSLNQDLLEEGYDPNSEDFYVEIDSRMQRFFPEQFGGSEKDMVSSNNKSKNKNVDGDVEDSDEPQNQVTDDTSSTSTQQVSGSSRKSPTKVEKVSRKGAPKVSSHAAELSDRWGIPLSNMANRIKEAENAEDGWTRIV